ncbi:uncharacterized protein METZ01_LOCUS496806, partial [marine metagenome]
MKQTLLVYLAAGFCLGARTGYEVKPLTEAQAKEYKLDRGFYKKATLVQDILIVTSGKVADLAHLETAHQFDMLMHSIKPMIADRVRRKKVLCLLIGHNEFTSQLPQFISDKKGK